MKIVQPCNFNDVCYSCQKPATKFVSIPVRTIEERFNIMLCRNCLSDAAQLMLTVDPKKQMEDAV